MENTNNSQQTVTEAVYKVLRDGTHAIVKNRTDMAVIDEQVGSGRFSPQAVKELKETRARISAEARRTSDAALKNARELINQYRTEESERLNRLNPKEITDDIQLLKSGISLTQKDCEDILSRSEGNATMRSLVKRYAAEHDISISAKCFLHDNDFESRAKVLESIVSYYSRWIGTGRAIKMLNTFFGEAIPGFFDEVE